MSRSTNKTKKKIDKKTKKNRKVRSRKLSRNNSRKNSKKIKVKLIRKKKGKIGGTDEGNVTLTECLKHLNNPRLDKSPPKICYKKLDFPDEKKVFQIGNGSSYLFFKELFPKQISITDSMVVYDDLKIYVPDNLKDELLKKMTRFVIIPINFKNSDNYYAILLDNRNQEWQIFIPPGNQQIKNHDKLEIKIRTLIDEHLKMPVRYFYESIQYRPKPDTVHYDFWPSWIIYQRIKKTTQREIMVNDALEQILRNSSEYVDFITKYKNYLSK